LRMAKVTQDPKQQAGFVAKAADLKARADETNAREPASASPEDVRR
jgi:hypothetical protein